MTMPNRNGCLFIVATPIGNLADMTYRAVEVLKSVDLIAAEDTRHSQQLFIYYGIKTPAISLHQHNEQQRITELLPRLQAGEQLALITDAGTPLISDPGARLVLAMHQANIPVVPVPGACAAISALVVSGLSAGQFVFEGFLPAKSVARRQRLQQLAAETRTLIFYEAPHRILDLLSDLAEICGVDRLATIARELTKTFETVRHDTVTNLLQWASADPNQQKGELVVILQGATMAEIAKNPTEIQRILSILLPQIPLKQAVALTVDLTQAKRNLVYQIALNLHKDSQRI
jgi:16S rRNA (cytidine1402-2'-O)-methyltransferase